MRSLWFTLQRTLWITLVSPHSRHNLKQTKYYLKNHHLKSSFSQYNSAYFWFTISIYIYNVLRVLVCNISLFSRLLFQDYCHLVCWFGYHCLCCHLCLFGSFVGIFLFFLCLIPLQCSRTPSLFDTEVFFSINSSFL